MIRACFETDTSLCETATYFFGIFHIKEVISYAGAYDFQSIMHYPLGKNARDKKPVLTMYATTDGIARLIEQHMAGDKANPQVGLFTVYSDEEPRGHKGTLRRQTFDARRRGPRRLPGE